MARPASKETQIIQEIIATIPKERLAKASPADVRAAIEKKKLDFDALKPTISNELSKARKKAGVAKTRRGAKIAASGWDFERYNTLMREVAAFVSDCGGSPAEAKEWLGSARNLVENLGSFQAVEDAIDNLGVLKEALDEPNE